MGKTRNTGFSNNAIQYNSGSIAFVSGSTTLLNISSSGNIVTTGTITANTLVIQTVTSSVSFVTGSTKFGSINSNTHQFTGSLLVSGSSTALNINNGALFVSSSGFIGIGVTGSTTPVRLSVSGAIESLTDGGGEGGQITLRGTTFQYGIDNFNGNNFRIIRENDGTGAAGTVLMNISASGNVGIGTTSTVGKLDINAGGNTNIVISNDSVDTGYNIISLNGTRTKGSYAGIAGGGTGDNNLYLNSGNDVVVQTGASYTARMRITSAGNVGIGISAPSAKLHVYGTATVFNMLLENSNSNAYTVYQAKTANSSLWQFGVWNDNSYRVGISGVADLITVDSTGFVTFQGNGFGFTIGQAASVNRMDYNGSTFRCLNSGNSFTPIAASAFNVNSDYRLKEDLKEFNNSMDILNSIKIYDFKWKDREERNYGVIAHELQEVLPYAVYGEKDEMEINGEIRTQGVDYGKLVPVLVKAIQELKAENDALKTRIETLENK